MAITSTDIVNRAIYMIGDDQTPVTGTAPSFDSSPAGVAAAQLYTGVVQTVAKLHGWDFSRCIATLMTSGNSAPDGWAYEYLYPTNGIEVRQIKPATVTDPNNPSPTSWTVGNALVSSVPTRVIWTNQASAVALFTNQPPESAWDAGFIESVARLLASEMAMAIEGRPQTAVASLESAKEFEQSFEQRNG